MMRAPRKKLRAEVIKKFAGGGRDFVDKRRKSGYYNSISNIAHKRGDK